MTSETEKMNHEAARMSDLVAGILKGFYYKHPCIHSPMEVEAEYSLCYDDIDIVSGTAASISRIEKSAVEAAWVKYGMDLSVLSDNQMRNLRDY